MRSVTVRHRVAAEKYVTGKIMWLGKRPRGERRQGS